MKLLCVLLFLLTLLQGETLQVSFRRRLPSKQSSSAVIAQNRELAISPSEKLAKEDYREEEYSSAEAGYSYSEYGYNEPCVINKCCRNALNVLKAEYFLVKPFLAAILSYGLVTGLQSYNALCLTSLNLTVTNTVTQEQTLTGTVTVTSTVPATITIDSTTTLFAVTLLTITDTLINTATVTPSTTTTVTTTVATLTVDVTRTDFSQSCGGGGRKRSIFRPIDFTALPDVKSLKDDFKLETYRDNPSLLDVLPSFS